MTPKLFEIRKMKAKLAKMGNVTMDDFSEYKNLVQDNALLVLEALEQQIRQRQMRDISSKTVSFEDVCAYADEPEPYKPQVGDRVRVEGVVLNARHGILDDANGVYIEVEPCSDKNKNTRFWLLEESYKLANLTFLSRPPRKVTRAEVEKLLGGEFELVD